MKNTKEKIELIKNGTFERYLDLRKLQFHEDKIPTDDPSFYNVSMEEMKWLQQLQQSTRRKKQEFRKHTRYMNDNYDNLGLLTLTYSNETINKSNFETKKHQTTKILSKCFNDYIGKFEFSTSGRIHGHFLVAWNGDVITKKTQDYKRDLVINKSDLTELWGNVYGIYDLILVDKNKESNETTSNYILKDLNTMESYINKAEKTLQLDLNNVDEDMIILVNTSNIIVKRNSAYQHWKKDNQEENKLIRSTCRAFDTEYYNKHKWDNNTYFKEWAIKNKNNNIALGVGKYKAMLSEDFELISQKEYVIRELSS